MGVFQCTESSIILSEKRYLQSILNQFGMASAKTAPISVVENIDDRLAENYTELLSEN